MNRTLPLLLKADTNVDFEWNIVVELPGATFPLSDAIFDMQVRDPSSGALALRFLSSPPDTVGSLLVAGQDAVAQTATLAFYQPQSAIAALNGAYDASFTMTRTGIGRSMTLAKGAIIFNPVPTV